MPLKSIAFFFISFLWSSLSLLRRLYPRKKIPCFVCSIGNLQAGGAGKTPLIMEIAKQLLEKGYHPAILTRGYRGTKEHDITLLSPGKSFLAQEVGDEAALMHALLPKVLIGVGKNRFEVYQKMLQSPIPFNVILLDDGFGVTLKKDFDVLLLTPAKRFERFF
jgi:tetraacyldisaccharide 4'-kinase